VSKLSHAWLALVSMIGSYGILVSVVVVGAFWINKQFTEAQGQRCDILQAEVGLSLIEVNIMVEVGSIDSPEPSEALRKEVRDLQAQIERICPR